LTTPFQMKGGYSAFHLYVICLDNRLANKNHLQVFEILRSFGIGVNLHYIPVYRQPYYREMGFHNTQFPGAEKYYQEAISLPMFSLMSIEEQDRVVVSLKRSLDQ